MKSGCPGQVEFSAGQVTSHSHLPEGQGGSSLSTKMLKKLTKTFLGQGKFESCSSYQQAGIQVFFQPCDVIF